MDPLLKEFVLFFAVWPVVIVATIFIGMRIGKHMSRRQDVAARGPAARGPASRGPASRGPAFHGAAVARAAKPLRQPG